MNLKHQFHFALLKDAIFNDFLDMLALGRGPRRQQKPGDQMPMLK